MKSKSRDNPNEEGKSLKAAPPTLIYCAESPPTSRVLGPEETVGKYSGSGDKHGILDGYCSSHLVSFLEFLF